MIELLPLIVNPFTLIATAISSIDNAEGSVDCRSSTWKMIVLTYFNKSEIQDIFTTFWLYMDAFAQPPS